LLVAFVDAIVTRIVRQYKVFDAVIATARQLAAERRDHSEPYVSTRAHPKRRPKPISHSRPISVPPAIARIRAGSGG
jgi:hypothetical protein